MPNKQRPSNKKSQRSTALSQRTKKQIDSLPQHAQHIFKKTHDNAGNSTTIQQKEEEVKNKVLKKSHTKQPGRQLRRSTKRMAING